MAPLPGSVRHIKPRCLAIPIFGMVALVVHPIWLVCNGLKRGRPWLGVIVFRLRLWPAAQLAQQGLGWGFDLGQGVGLVDCFGGLAQRQVGVYLGALRIDMAHQCASHMQRRIVFGQLGAEEVAGRVGMGFGLGNASGIGITLEHALHTTARKAASPARVSSKPAAPAT